MKRGARLALAAVLVSAECGFAQDIELPCGAGDKACAFKALQSRPAKTMAFFGAKLPASSMTSIYESLGQTNFPTLYAATHPADDFAESFANYVHTVLMKKPFEIRISEEGRVTKRYGACWDEERCAEKRRILEAFLR